MDVLQGIRQEHLRRKARKCVHLLATAQHFHEKAKSYQNIKPKEVSKEVVEEDVEAKQDSP